MSCIRCATPAGGRTTWRAFAGRLLCFMLDLRDHGRQRRTLATLDDRQLGDIGLGRAAARREAEKPFWR
ncbi:MAG: DUF1127 domain-containing protein [Dongiaceae bacterium]